MRAARLLLLIPPVFLGTFLATITTIFVYGNIHGLTLSFGSAIIGLTLDYGLHSAFNENSKKVWISNFWGFVTTAICLVVLGMSQIPLLRQLTLFSLFGFSYTYLILWFLQRRYPNLIVAKPIPIPLASTPLVFGLVLLVTSGSLLGPFLLHPNLDLNQFDFKSQQGKEVAEWFYKSTLSRPPLFQIDTLGEGSSPLIVATGRTSWAMERGIRLESVSHYIPAPPVQLKHLAEWKALQCGRSSLTSLLSPMEQKLFAPFLQLVSCEALNPVELQNGKIPRYVRHLYNEKRLLTLWFPKTNEESESIRNRFPEVVSLAEVAATFPNTLAQELKWMAPLSLFLVALLVFIYYRSFLLTGICLLPFFTGAGLAAWVSLLFRVPFSIVSLIGLLMVLGLSVDYAIFAIDHFRRSEGKLILERKSGAGSALLFAAGSTIAGFLPWFFVSTRCWRIWVIR